TRGQKDDAAGLQDRSDTHRYGPWGNGRTLKMRFGIRDRFRCQHDLPRARSKTRSRFVECNVPVPSYADHQQIDSAGFTYFLLITAGLLWNMDVAGSDVHVIEEMPLHVKPVAMWIVSLQSEVFVQIEGRDP